MHSFFIFIYNTRQSETDSERERERMFVTLSSIKKSENILIKNKVQYRHNYSTNSILSYQFPHQPLNLAALHFLHIYIFFKRSIAGEQSFPRKNPFSKGTPAPNRHLSRARFLSLSLSLSHALSRLTACI